MVTVDVTTSPACSGAPIELAIATALTVGAVRSTVMGAELAPDSTLLLPAASV